MLWSITDGTTGTASKPPVYDVSIDGSGNIWWAGMAGSNGQYSQVNVSPTSTPYDLSVDTVSGATNALLVEWTQPGGMAPTRISGASTTPSIDLASMAPTGSAPQTQSIIYAGDVLSPGPLSISPESEPSPLELWIGGT